MNPKHSNPTQIRGVWAHAPYNFIPLPEKVVSIPIEDLPKQDKFENNTGLILCILTTQSPTYTRCALTPELFQKLGDKSFNELTGSEQKEYANFFLLDGVPIIPGSTIRGMIRNLVEIAGFGSIKWVTKENLTYRAVGDTSSLGKFYRAQMDRSKIRAGYMHQDKGVWVIIPATPIGKGIFARISHVNIQDNQRNLHEWYTSKNAWKIRVTPPEDYGYREILVKFASGSLNKEYQDAVLVQTGEIRGKRKDFVFGLPDNRETPILIPQILVNLYHDQLTQGQMSLLGKEGVLREMQPVFYLNHENSLIFFGHAMMFRIPYPHVPSEFVPSTSHNTNQRDIAEVIFGYIDEEERGSACAGRVFFSDAKCETYNKEVWLSQDEITPKILASPKPTTFQHYLVQSKESEHNPDKIELLAHYATPTPSETIIRGQKMYWHQNSIDLQSIQESDTKKIEGGASQYTRIKPVKAGVTFTFRVYFENLRDWELGAILWALSLPGKAGVKYYHKVGMGKPLGMGSVQITPELQLSDRIKRYSLLFENNQWFCGKISNAQIGGFIKSFETFIFEKIDPSEKANAGKLADIPRIQMLLKMLEWPGPSQQLTSYMTIEPKNEYKVRPVLPDPLHIEQHTENITRPPPHSGKSARKEDYPRSKQDQKPNARGQSTSQARNKPKEDPYLDTIKDILETEHPVSVSALSLSLNKSGNWDEKHYVKLKFKKFSEVVEAVIRRGGINCIIDGQNIIWKTTSTKSRR